MKEADSEERGLFFWVGVVLIRDPMVRAKKERKWQGRERERANEEENSGVIKLSIYIHKYLQHIVVTVC